MELLWHLAWAVLLTEATTEILAESALLRPLRERLGGPDPRTLPPDADVRWYRILAWCGYCLSMWAGVAWSYAFWVAPIPLMRWIPAWIHPLIAGVGVHRLSNVVHGLARRIMSKAPFMFSFRGITEVQHSEPDRQA